MSAVILKKLLFNHDGTGHKIAHNITTIANIPLVIWLIYSVFTLRSANYEDFANYMASPVNIVLAVLFVYVTLKHFVLEIEVVFEDYVSNISMRHFYIMSLKIFSFILGLTTIISILKLGL